jgi:CubicO group peptidase (beta-lactamase class C family)
MSRGAFRRVEAPLDTALGRVYPGPMGLSRGVVVLATALVVSGGALSGCKASDPRAERAGALLDDAILAEGPGCSAAVAERGEVVWTYARGLADLDGSIPIDTSTRFNIASVTKQFTATAALMLAEDGKLALSDGVSDYVDGLPPWSDEVTVGDLMTHTSGIADLVAPVDDIVDREILLQSLAEHPGARRANTSFYYSNDNYMLLGLIVEEAGGLDLAEWVQAEIFAPYELDMALEPGAVADDIALGYREGSPPFTPSPDTYLVPGPTGILSTPSELARWGDHYRDPQTLSKVTLEEALNAAVPVDGPGEGYRYGPGVFLSEDETIEHIGNVAGTGTYFAVSSDRMSTLALSCNWRIWSPDEIAAGLVQIWFSGDEGALSSD